jgi:uncharacterized protein involved in exopolysaccharide biosynthesis
MNDKKPTPNWEAMFQVLFKLFLLSYPFAIAWGVWVNQTITRNESSIRQLETWKSEGHAKEASLNRAEILRDVGSDAQRRSDENGNRIESLRATLMATTAELATFRALTEHKMIEMANTQKRMLEILERK